jgi:uncharacterized protein (DUF1330 family)
MEDNQMKGHVVGRSVLEFPSSERAKGWLHSPKYREIRKMRHRTPRLNMILLENA